MPTPIVINGAFVSQRVTGQQRYAMELGRRLLHHEDVRLVVPRAAPPWAAPSRCTRVPGPPLARDSWAWANIALPRAVRRDEVLWSATTRAPLRSPRHVVTIHDVAVLEHPEWYSRKFAALYRVVLPLLARSSTTVLAPSTFSKDRIVRVLGTPPEKVRVVGEGVDERFRPARPEEVRAVRAQYGLAEQFILSLGTVQPRKNLGRLIEAWAALPRPTRAEWPLVLAGERGPQFARHAVTPTSGGGPTFLGYVPDETLPALYSAASLFVYPSLYEGFGLPPLEAMRCGVPVIAANTGACSEVLAGGAVLVDPMSTDDLCAAILHLIESEGERHRLAAGGPTHAERFSWHDAASQVLRCLREVGS